MAATTIIKKQDAFTRLHEALCGGTKLKSSGLSTPLIPTNPLDENVYRLIPEVYVIPRKEKRYKSQFANQARKEYKSNLKNAASMGPLKVPLHPQTDFLKKGKGVPKPIAPASRHVKTVFKAPVPDTLETTILPPSKKDYVKQNALDNINAFAKKVGKEKATYMLKKDYGVVPDYLRERISEMKESELKRARQLAKQQNEKETSSLEEKGIVVLPDQERERILKGLQDNWEKLNKDYQRLSLTVDTVPKISRKVNLENQLKQYEELIDKFSNTNIHVSFATAYSS